MEMALRAQTADTFPSLPQLLIDSGASSSVAGKSWLTTCLRCGGVSAFPQLRPSRKVFRFGGGISYASFGAVTVCGNTIVMDADNVPHSKPMAFNMDIISLNLPFWFPENRSLPYKDAWVFLKIVLVLRTDGGSLQEWPSADMYLLRGNPM